MVVPSESIVQGSDSSDGLRQEVTVQSSARRNAEVKVAACADGTSFSRHEVMVTVC